MASLHFSSLLLSSPLEDAAVQVGRGVCLCFYAFYFVWPFSDTYMLNADLNKSSVRMPAHSLTQTISSQDRADANRLKMDEMKDLQDKFNERMSRFVLDASDRQALAEVQMAKADVEAEGMRTAYEQLASDNAQQQETAAWVGSSA